MYIVKEVGPEGLPGFMTVYAAVAAGGQPLAGEWAAHFAELLASGSRIWLIGHDRTQPVGYAILNPVPGLVGVYDLNGGIIPVGRRRGLGAALLSNVRAAAAESGAQRLSARVEDLANETATWLLRRGFSVEHEEVLLQRDLFGGLPPVPLQPPGDLVTYPRARAIREFCRLYDESFQDMPWSQPYDEDEVEETLDDAGDLLFMEVDGRLIGVVWQQISFNERGQVEPLGIIPAYHGQGYGRRLLLAALHQLSRRAFSLEIGTWRQNTVALNLYKSVGFSEVQNWYYLSCDLQGLKGE